MIIFLSKLAVIFIIAEVVLVIAIMGWSATNLFSKNVTDEPAVKIKWVKNYLLIISDNVQRIEV